MPTITISKTKIRRGTNSQRKQLIFDQGEVVYTTDTKRVFVGTGFTSGGVVAGSQVHAPISSYVALSTIDSEVGDLVNVNNIFYQLTSTDYTNINSWANVGLRINPTTFSYDTANSLNLNVGSISAGYLNSNTVLSGVKIQNGVLQVNYNTKHFDLSGESLSVKLSGIGYREIANSSFGQGIKGGSGSVITLDVDTSNGLTYVGNTLTFSLTGAAPIPIQASSLSGSLGPGLVYNSGASQIWLNPDSSLKLNGLSGTIGIKNSLSAAGSSEWPSISVDAYGSLTNYVSSIYSTLSSIHGSIDPYTPPTYGGLFNGVPSQGLTKQTLSTISGVSPTLSTYGLMNQSLYPATVVTTLSSNGSTTSTVYLSSAGFIVFEGNTGTRTGNPVGRFAIPIFTY